MGQQIGEGSIDGEATSVGEFHAHPTPVGRVGLTLHEGSRLESVDAIGHGSAGDHGLGRQLPWGQGVGSARAPQRREHIELPPFEVVLGEGRRPSLVKVSGQSSDAGQDA